MLIKYWEKVLIFINRSSLTALIIIFSSFSLIYGQNTREESPPLKERLFIGGNFGLQLGTITNIQISPVIGLWLLPRLAIAIGPDYRFYKDRYDHTNIYGGKGYIQFVIIKNINSVIPIGVNTGVFLHVENELLSLESSVWKDPALNGRFYVNTVLAGGGISQQIGRRSSLNFMVLWALNDSGYHIYSNPEIRVSFSF
ncbi:MAG: hypothetical protein EPN88_12725 [Bacteroidetes bacterium]|nr:MAG: hypothetical protein EPN88_12725 [Bacteroidota bacterium]